MSQSTKSGTIGSSATKLDDLSFDLVSILYRKSQGLEAYEKYLRDTGQNQPARNLIQRLYQQDAEAVRQLRTITSQCLGGNSA